jgi:SpoVK/Ycf46/Vps4 family AAA+-type ATPase
LRALKLEPTLSPDRLAADLASATLGHTGADIAYLCQRAAMVCVKEAVGAGEANEGIAIARRHFDTALSFLTTAHATEAAPETRQLLLAC